MSPPVPQRRAAPDPRPAVEARAVVRDAEGWRIVTLRLPAALAEGHMVAMTPPYTAVEAAAKLEQWVTDLATGTGR